MTMVKPEYNQQLSFKELHDPSTTMTLIQNKEPERDEQGNVTKEHNLVVLKTSEVHSRGFTNRMLRVVLLIVAVAGTCLTFLLLYAFKDTRESLNNFVAKEMVLNRYYDPASISPKLPPSKNPLQLRNIRVEWNKHHSDLLNEVNQLGPLSLSQMQLEAEKEAEGSERDVASLVQEKTANVLLKVNEKLSLLKGVHFRSAE